MVLLVLDMHSLNSTSFLQYVYLLEDIKAFQIVGFEIRESYVRNKPRKM
jgi:hypothetical protein